ncbi:hypothetical protein N7462_003669 [Penicillium macrosclerotiorum]|uniref:uncharacterized protein n=1 Tax=Penicillium macrosclerotiorum TaxID=303699 RepID=UPI0025477B0A|nr:uncharacterized protein N7462_003669 [Penicillium macrosclerotiorum]KAJ5689277.1 hypothetical protein N7462_003669 [Penicillium macrosclerotiorum]
MHLPSVFTSLATLLTITAAVPVVAQNTTPRPTPTKAAIPSPIFSSIATPSMTPVGAYQCPQKQFKQCCMSLEQTSRTIVHGLGELVPVLSGVQLSSAISFQCKPMEDSVSPNACNDEGYGPMCCASSGSSGAVNTCKPFAQAKEEYYRSFGFQDESQADYINDVLS